MLLMKSRVERKSFHHMFNMAHVHLLMNHFPIIGSMFISVMFIIALLFKNVFLQKVSLWFLVGVALSTAVTYASGGGTKSAVQGLPYVSNTMIAAHEQAARYGLILMFVAGLLALSGIVLYSKRPVLPLYFRVSVLAILLISVVVLTYVGFLGGQIMHPEIRSLITHPFSKML
jgi:uncharacterized membrane protein